MNGFYPRGRLARGAWESVVDDSIAGWRHTGIRVAELTGGTVELEAGAIERIIVPLAGSFTVEHDDEATVLHGRASVFDGPTDVLYLPCGSGAVIRGTGRVAVAEAPTDEVRPSRYIPASEVPVEQRGAGASSRRVHNFGTPETLDAARLIVCEVVTPAGNWSSYPPHKHDELEEIYYFESAGFGLFHTDELTTAVRAGDIALVPSGFHGPAAAPPGYDLYYLNVMAGPGERAWIITDDPRHAWIRETWKEEGR